MNTVVCAVVNTIGFFVAIVLYVCGINWVSQNYPTIANFCLIAIMIFGVLFVFANMYEFCKESNQKKTATNVNQTVKKITPVQSNNEPVTYSTHSRQNTTSTQCDVKPTKQYPVLEEIQNIISNLSELEKDNDLDKNMFTKFHKLKEQFDLDYQKTIKILNKLKTIEQFDETHLTIFNHYLDLFKNEQNTIYEKIKQQYNNELNIIDDKLHHFNEMIDKVL